MSTHYQENVFYMDRERITWAVRALILTHIAVFAAQLALEIPLGGNPRSLGLRVTGGDWVEILLAFQPTLFLKGFLWKPFTYLFLHSNLSHLFFNMLWLFFFGPEVERTLGSRQFIMFYVVSGALAVLATMFPLVLWGSDPSVTGASGCAMAVLVAFAMIEPDRRLFLFPLPVPINVRALIIILIAMNLVWGVQEGGTTSVATHFGGMLAGLGLIKMIPLIHQWQRERERTRQSQHGASKDAIGEAVDNIFRFEDRKRGK